MATARKSQRAGTRVESQPRSARKTKRARPGWVPKYHGAWAMIIVPPILGVIEGGWQPVYVPLILTWWVGYFLFYAATMWLRSRMQRRYLQPVLVYGAATGVLGLATWAAAPYLWRWVPLFVPLVAAAAWAAWKRKDRSLGAGLDTTLAACVMLPVVWDASTGGAAGLGANPHIWAQAALLFGYFAGTVFYVKTNIRERHSTGYLIGSWVWHIAWAAVAVALAVGVCGVHISVWHAVTWLVLVVRAVVVPMCGRRGHPLSVAAIGVGEIVFSVAIMVTLLV